MKAQELAAGWIAETECIAGLVRHDFMHLDEKQLDYRVHIGHCSIRQIMHQVFSTNSSLFACIERAIPFAGCTGHQQEYRPGYLAKYLLGKMSFTGCLAEKITGRNAERWELSPDMLFQAIISQQNRIKELVTLCRSVDVNRRVVPFRLYGLIKLSIAETFEYLILNQKKHFIIARHIMILQEG